MAVSQTCWNHNGRIQATVSFLCCALAVSSVVMIIANVRPFQQKILEKTHRSFSILGYPTVRLENMEVESQFVQELMDEVLENLESDPATAKYLRLEEERESVVHLPMSQLRRRLKSNETSASDNSNATGKASSISITEKLIPGIILGLSSTIILCSLIIYCSDLKEKHRFDKWIAERSNNKDSAENDLENSPGNDKDEGAGYITSASSASDTESEFWVHTNVSHEMLNDNPSNILPPLHPEDTEQRDDDETTGVDEKLHSNTEADSSPENLSLSDVSTLTGSGTAYTDTDEKIEDKAIEASDEVTELSDIHRVADGTDFNNLVQSADIGEGDEESLYGSLIDGTNESLVSDLMRAESSASKAAIGKIDSSVARAGDFSTMEQRDASGTKAACTPSNRVGPEESAAPKEKVEIEALVASIPFSKIKSRPAPFSSEEATIDRVVRDIYFVPIPQGSTGTVGLDLNDATSVSAYPCVDKVDVSSTFVGRIFQGDLILAANTTNTAGMSGKEVLRLIEGFSQSSDDSSDTGSQQMENMVKLTVLSHESDTSSLLSDEQRSLDFGLPDSCIEV
eukprot:CAMPEP_0195301834 /NCGR_PEP_ID=MMETSP0707-20130614/30027_1 /TAXON_ID=33640 /ORGANISM="Asterionellopsis glacialis, Strain CCMP134" /LENGTH=568 /DNA_ID=CAMNT_0040364913 /DNA_START=149 /DNA_END=1855 /DNA_ORIENTATION=-